MDKKIKCIGCKKVESETEILFLCEKCTEKHNLHLQKPTKFFGPYYTKG